MNLAPFLLSRANRDHYLALIRFDKPIGTLLLLYPALTALVLAAQGTPSGKNLFIFTLGAFLMRSAGCAINDFADRHWDGAVARTKTRPLAQKKITPQEACTLAGVMTLIAFILVLFTNLKTIQLSFVAAFVAFTYPFCKRFTHLPQAVLAVAFAWSIPMAFTAEGAPLTSTTWLLFLATIFWTLAYDTIYAIADRKDDIVVGIRSSAILFGRLDRVFVALFQLLTLACYTLCFVALGHTLTFPSLFGLLILSIALLFAYQQYLIRNHQPEGCLKAFQSNHWIGLLMLIGAWIQLVSV